MCRALRSSLSCAFGAEGGVFLGYLPGRFHGSRWPLDQQADLGARPDGQQPCCKAGKKSRHPAHTAPKGLRQGRPAGPADCGLRQGRPRGRDYVGWPGVMSWPLLTASYTRPVSIGLVSGDAQQAGPDTDGKAQEWMSWTGETDLRLMSDDPARVEPDDDEIAEEWIRWTGEPWIRFVGACKVDVIGPWLVSIGAQEFCRRDPLGAELRRRVQGALRAVDGVTGADEHDNETWYVTDTPSGEALIRAAARVVDDMALRLRPAGSRPPPASRLHRRTTDISRTSSWCSY
jgi:hypothetical protein